MSFYPIGSNAKAEELRSLGAGVEGENGEPVLPLIEAAYFAEKGKIDADAAELLAKAKEEDGLAEEKYAVLKHLRGRGYIVRCGTGEGPWMRVYRKGYRPRDEQAVQLLKVVKGGGPQDLLSDLEKAGKMRKKLAYAFVEGGKIVFAGAGRISFE